MLQSTIFLQVATTTNDFLGIPLNLWVLFALVAVVWGVYFYRSRRLKK